MAADTPPPDMTTALPPLPTPSSFPFPYPQPYSIQLDLMRTVFDAIEQGKIAIIESPTGTGKSLTLLTSTLTWLQQNATRVSDHSLSQFKASLASANSDDPPWVIQHAIDTRLEELQRGQLELKERLRKARAVERKRVKDSRDGRGAFKKVKVTGEGGSSASTAERQAGKGASEDDEFLPDDAGAEAEPTASDGISPEVRALLAKLEGRTTSATDEDEPETPKIFYTSRTHTQLRQLSTELHKTTFARGRVRSKCASGPAEGEKVKLGVRKRVEIEVEGEEEEQLPVRVVPLGGRRQLCINAKVKDIGKAKGDERMNEACLDLQKADSKKGRCPHLPPKEKEQEMLDFRDSILATPRDIEDVVQLGRERSVCPYYATRKSVRQAELVTLPYNLLLQKTAREALGIVVKDQVVVIDEAHNLIDTLLSIHSMNIPLSRFKIALDQIVVYLGRFRTRLKPAHALHIKRMIAVLSGIIRACEGWARSCGGAGQKKEELFKTNELARMMMKDGADQVDLIELVGYLKDSQLARKVSGYAEKEALRGLSKEGKPGNNSATAISSFHQVESFLLSLTASSEDGRVILSTEPSRGAEGEVIQSVVMRYMLLNPAEHFLDIVTEARCVVLAGGTMEPISDFLIQLFPSIPRDRFSLLSCAHVIPRSNLLTQVVCRGPSKREMEFKFDSRGDVALLLDLGALVSSMINLIPDGVVIFLPSYSFLTQLKDVWSKSGLLTKLDGRKKVFYEPQSSAEVDTVLNEYSAAITGTKPPGSRQTGALLLAVVGAKLSEGINFSDALGRCVIMVGLPFANSGSTELRERMKYVEGIPDAPKNAGQELYENLCMRAVNQSIGRAIRHQNDYATLLLVDKRYATQRISKKLPKWIGQDVKTGDFPEAVRAVAGFFRGKRQQQEAKEGSYS